MTMINLQASCSLPVEFDQSENFFHFSEELDYDLETRVTLSDLVPILLNKSLLYPDSVYTEFSGLRLPNHKKIFRSKLTYDIVCLPQGLLGIEYIKSHIYHSPSKNENDLSASCVVEVLHGVITIILQKTEWEEDSQEVSVGEGFILKVRKGTKVVIPKGYHYTFINTKDVPAIFARIHCNGMEVDYSTLEREQGLGYYLIRKNARQELVHNPRYKFIPEIQKRQPAKLSKIIKIIGKRPLYSQAAQNPKKFLRIL